MRNWLILILLLLHSPSFAQHKVIVRFRDAINDMPLADVQVTDLQGRLMARSDTGGYVTLPFASSPLIAMLRGYRPDTLHTPGASVYLQPLSVTLDPAIIRSSRVSLLLHENNEYVVDYGFSGNRIIAATYSGNNGGKAKLFLLDHEGNTLASCRLPNTPVSVFKSCVGVPYCVCNDVFYRIGTGSDNILIDNTYPINLLEGLRQCEQAAYGNLYYKIGDRLNFRTTFGIIEKGDSTFKPFTAFEEKDVALASWREWMEVLALLNAGHFSKAARKQSLRLMWDEGSFKHINLPLFINNDTLLVFNYFGKSIMYYNLAGKNIGSSPIHFEWKQSQLFSIVKDDARGKFYIHRHEQSHQVLEELNVNTGYTSSVKVLIDKPFAEQVKVYDGSIYYLWQNRSASSTRQLYIQSID